MVLSSEMRGSDHADERVGEEEYIQSIGVKAVASLLDASGRSDFASDDLNSSGWGRLSSGGDGGGGGGESNGIRNRPADILVNQPIGASAVLPSSQLELVWDILVVDDSPLNRKMLMKTMKAAGHVVEVLY